MLSSAQRLHRRSVTVVGASQHPSCAWVHSEVEHAVQHLAAADSDLAIAIVQGHDGVDLRDLDQTTAAVGDALPIRHLASPANDQAIVESVELQGLVRSLQVVTHQVHVAVPGWRSSVGCGITGRWLLSAVSIPFSVVYWRCLQVTCCGHAGSASVYPSN
jgi:hypothetical protein